MEQYITHEPDDDTEWICLCGNTSHRDGFATCTKNGMEIEPIAGGEWAGHYCCNGCSRIIENETRRVIGIAPKHYEFTWRGIAIEVIYTPLKWGVIAHLEIRSIEPERAPLPITSTGYLSHFHQPGIVEAHGGDVIAQVSAWLDQQAAKPAWLAYEAQNSQLSLF